MCAAKAKGGADRVRSAIERRQEILERLSVRRVDTIGNLMVEFGVSRSTIKRDLEIIGWGSSNERLLLWATLFETGPS